jgi:carbonic anhydrase
MRGSKFATAINCMDGRVQSPVTEWLKYRFGVDYVDMITEPGPERVLADDLFRPTIDSIYRKIHASIMFHNSEIVAVIGHHDCAGNPVNKEIQHKQILNAVRLLKSWCVGVKVVGLWVEEKRLSGEYYLESKIA